MNTFLYNLTLDECISLIYSYESTVLFVLCFLIDFEFNTYDLYLSLLHVFLMMTKGGRISRSGVGNQLEGTSSGGIRK